MKSEEKKDEVKVLKNNLTLNKSNLRYIEILPKC